MPTLTELIKQKRTLYVSEGQVPDFQTINCGLCPAFAEEVESEYGGTVEILSNDMFMLKVDDGWNGDGHDTWDADILNHYHSLPTHGLEAVDLEHFILDYHVWLYADGRHYDAECPEGVENFFDLPFFERCLQVKESLASALQGDYIDQVLHLHSLNPNRWTGECASLNGLHIGVMARMLYKYFDEVEKKKHLAYYQTV